MQRGPVLLIDSFYFPRFIVKGTKKCKHIIFYETTSRTFSHRLTFKIYDPANSVLHTLKEIRCYKHILYLEACSNKPKSLKLLYDRSALLSNLQIFGDSQACSKKEIPKAKTWIFNYCTDAIVQIF